MADSPIMPTEPETPAQSISRTTSSPVVSAAEMEPKQNLDRFIGIIAILVGLVVFVLQSNGVEMNWLVSLALYIAIACAMVWSCLRHAVPHLGRTGRLLIACAAFLLVCSVGYWGTSKQYQREHPTRPSAQVELSGEGKQDSDHDANKTADGVKGKLRPAQISPSGDRLYPEVLFVYRNKTIEILNQGKQDIYLWSGAAYGDAILPMETKEEPRVIAPGNFYYLFADEMEGEFVKALGSSTAQGLVPIHAFVKMNDSRKYTVRGELLAKFIDGKLTIHTQMLPPVQGWTNKPPAGTFLKLPDDSKKP